MSRRATALMLAVWLFMVSAGLVITTRVAGNTSSGERPIPAAADETRESPAPPSSPREISGLQLWLDAAAISGITDGDAVTTWSDLSDNAYDATQVATTSRPTLRTRVINGLPVVRFDGTSDSLEVGTIRDSKGRVHVFSVGQRLVVQVSGPKYQRVISAWDGIGNDDWRGSSWTVAAPRDGEGNPVGFGLAVEEFSRPSGVEIDNVTLAMNSRSESHFFSGDIAEIIVFDRQLNATEQDIVLGYLSDKWGLVAGP